MLITTAVTGGFLAMINPYLLGLLTYDMFLLGNAFRVLSQTTEYINMCSSKRHIFLNKLNFLGYLKEPKTERISLREITYMGEYENKSLTMKHYGLLPSLAKLVQRFTTYNHETIDGDFSKFHKFMANNQVYLLSKDHPDHALFTVNEGLLDDIIHGKQKRIFEYDFSEEDRQKSVQFKEMEDEIKRVMEFKGEGYVTQEDKLKREYSYYWPNREFSGSMEDVKLKKIDDGTFVDNGYR